MKPWKIVAVFCIFISLFFIQSVYHWQTQRQTNVWAFVAVVLFAFMIIAGTVWMLQNRGVISIEISRNLVLLASAGVMALFLCELVLRNFASNLASYGERNGSDGYNSSYWCCLSKCKACDNGYYYMNPPNGFEDFNKPEFHYMHTYNSLGLRDKEFSESKKANEYRIMGIGDSFTEGVGTAQDSTWLKQLEYRLNSKAADTIYTTLNCGTHGNDLIREYDFLENCLLKYKPDLLILNLNSTDINDILSRGVYAKPDANGNILNPAGPWYEFLFGASYLARFVFLNLMHYTWMLYPEKDQHKVEDYILSKMTEKLYHFQALADKHRFKFLLITFPLENELADGQNILARLKIPTNIRHLSLYPYLNDSIENSKEKAKRFYYPIDGHFTTYGYGVQAEYMYRNYFRAEELTKTPYNPVD